MTRELIMILAGGKGSRLYPLSRDRAKPAVPFGGRYWNSYIHIWDPTTVNRLV